MRLFDGDLVVVDWLITGPLIGHGQLSYVTSKISSNGHLKFQCIIHSRVVIISAITFACHIPGFQKKRKKLEAVEDANACEQV